MSPATKMAARDFPPLPRARFKDGRRWGGEGSCSRPIRAADLEGVELGTTPRGGNDDREDGGAGRLQAAGGGGDTHRGEGDVTARDGGGGRGSSPQDRVPLPQGGPAPGPALPGAAPLRARPL